MSYYPIDIELLFSNSPFFSVDSKITQFAYIKPNASEKLVLPSNASTLQYEINKEYQFTNVMIELKSGAIQKYIPHYSHSMKVRIASDLGKLQVVQKKSGAPLSRVYVKVYGSTNGKTGTFYKDGYTDLLGIFDFLSNSNFNQLSVSFFNFLFFDPDLTPLFSPSNIYQYCSQVRVMDLLLNA